MEPKIAIAWFGLIALGLAACLGAAALYVLHGLITRLVGRDRPDPLGDAGGVVPETVYEKSTPVESPNAPWRWAVVAAVFLVPVVLLSVLVATRVSVVTEMRPPPTLRPPTPAGAVVPEWPVDLPVDMNTLGHEPSYLGELHPRPEPMPNVLEPPGSRPVFNPVNDTAELDWRPVPNWKFEFTFENGYGIEVFKETAGGDPSRQRLRTEGSDGTTGYAYPRDGNYRGILDNDLPMELRGEFAWRTLAWEGGRRRGLSTYRITNDGPIPDWVHRSLERDNENAFVFRDTLTVRGQQFADKKQAEADMKSRAKDWLIRNVKAQGQLNADGQRQLNQAFEPALKQIFFEPVERSSGSNTFLVWRAHGIIEDVSEWNDRLDRRVTRILTEQKAGGLLFLAAVWVVFGGGMTWALRGRVGAGVATMAAAVVVAGLVVASVA